MDKKTRRVKSVAALLDLDDFCQRCGYTNDMLAKELDVSRATIFNWKKDDRKLPRIVSLALEALQLNPQLRKVQRNIESAAAKQYRRATYIQIAAPKRQK